MFKLLNRWPLLTWRLVVRAVFLFHSATSTGVPRKIGYRRATRMQSVDSPPTYASPRNATYPTHAAGMKDVLILRECGVRRGLLAGSFAEASGKGMNVRFAKHRLDN